MSNCIILAIGGHWDSGNPVALQFKALADELVRRGNDVLILLPGQLGDKIIEKGNPLVYVWPSKRPTKLIDALFLYKIIRKHHPSCLIANFAAVNWMLLVGWLLQIKNRIAWYHTTVEAIETDAPEHRWVRVYHYLRKILIYRLAHHLVAVSSYTARGEILSKFHADPGKVKVFHNLLRDPTKENDYSSSPGEINDVILTCVARLDYSKGHDILLRAMPLVLKSFPKVELRVIGDGPKNSDLQAMAKALGVESNTQFTGRLKPSAVISHLSQSYVNIHPARVDNCPLALIESISVGTPVIASNAGGIPEIIHDGINGILVPPEDSESLASAICRLLEFPHLRKELAENARRSFLAEFELDQGIAMSYLQLEYCAEENQTSD
jgi:glycosyltransferase involved in cell wall biosynthesis